MSARAIWKGILKVNAVMFPVKAYKAYDEPGDGTALRMLHSECNTPINRQDHCTKCAKALAATDIVKGFDNGDGTFTLISKDMIDAITPESSDVIEVETFVPMADVDPLYVRETHYLAGDGKVAAEAYAMIASICKTKEVAGQGRWTVYGREHNVLVRAVNGGLAVSMMRTVNEVRDMAELPGYSEKPVTIDVRTLKIAGQVIDSMMGAFDQTEYEDSYAKDFRVLVATVQKGEQIAAKPARAAVQPSNLMDALTKSLATKATPKAKVAKASIGSGPKSSKKGKAS